MRTGDHGIRAAVLVVCLCGAAAGAEPETRTVCERFLSPFPTGDRASFRALQPRVSGRYGDFRRSYVRGHKHAGVDLDGRFREAVFAMCPGVVADIHLAFPHQTVVVAHSLPDGTRIFTSYKHLTEVGVRVGDTVDPGTRLGRLFDREEFTRSGFPRNHLHLEVRRRIDDGGSASWTSMDLESLGAFCLDPLDFLEPRMAR